VLLSKEDLQNIYQHAIDDYPDECCGIVIAPPGGGMGGTVFRCTNIQNKMHKEDPISYPRTARTAYLIDPKEQLKILTETEEKGMILKAFYHSHPNHQAYFSETDRREAMFGDEPAYPGTAYVVVSVIDRQVKDARCYLWDKEKKDFVERTLELR
jgi:proteasome lid subunit RPN8/RPN11